MSEGPPEPPTPQEQEARYKDLAVRMLMRSGQARSPGSSRSPGPSSRARGALATADPGTGSPVPSSPPRDPLDSLPRPTEQSAVEVASASRADVRVILWRGTSPEGLDAMRTAGSATGAPADPGCGRPTEAEARDQVARGGLFPEFTTRTDTARGFGSSGVVVVVKIAAKYLTQGSGTEGGWITYAGAPVQVVDSLVLGTGSTFRPNGS